MSSLEAQTMLDPLPMPSAAAAGNSMLPEIYTVRAEGVQGFEEHPEPIEHQWRGFQSDSEPDIKLTFRGGDVSWNALVSVEQVVINAPGEAEKVWCKITVDAITEEATAAEIDHAPTIPADTATEKHWLIAEIVEMYPGGGWYPAIRQIQFEPIRKIEPMPEGVGGDTLYHNGDGWVVLAAPSGSITNPVLSHTGTATVWVEDQMGSGTAPSGTYDGQLLYWDVATTAWKVSVAPTSAAIPYWDSTAKDFVWVAAGTSGHYLQTDGTDHVWAEVVGGADTIAVVAEITPSPQVRVTSAVVGATTTYTVRGNSVDKTLRYQVGAGTPVELAVFKDGLLTNDIAGSYVDIPVPAAGWTEPAGTEGDMLYHNGTTWVKFDGPTTPSSGYKNVLHHSGTVPSWTTYQELTVSICVAGVPTSYKILAIAVSP